PQTTVRIAGVQSRKADRPPRSQRSSETADCPEALDQSAIHCPHRGPALVSDTCEGGAWTQTWIRKVNGAILRIRERPTQDEAFLEEHDHAAQARSVISRFSMQPDGVVAFSGRSGRAAQMLLGFGEGTIGGRTLAAPGPTDRGGGTDIVSGEGLCHEGIE